MARRKDQSPLFEIIRGTQEGGGRPRIELPPWLKHPPQSPTNKPKPAGPAGTAPPSTPRPQGDSVSASTAATPTLSAKSPARPDAAHGADPSAIRIHHSRASTLADWFSHIVELRATRRRLVAIGSAGALAILLIYFGGYSIGVAVGQREDQPGQSLAFLGGTVAANPQALDTAIDGRATPSPTPASRTRQSGAPAAQAPTNRTAAGASRPSAPADRSPAPGFNYFILETLPATAVADGEKIVDYLGANGVDAALVPANDSGSRLWVVVLEGFSGESSPQASRLKSRLLQLGRGWKRQGGARDWSDMYGRLFR